MVAPFGPKRTSVGAPDIDVAQVLRSCRQMTGGASPTFKRGTISPQKCSEIKVSNNLWGSREDSENCVLSRGLPTFIATIPPLKHNAFFWVWQPLSPRVCAVC